MSNEIHQKTFEDHYYESERLNIEARKELSESKKEIEKLKAENERLSKVILDQEKYRQSTEREWKERLEAIQRKLQTQNDQLKEELKTWEEMAESHAKAMVILERDREELKRKLDLAVEALGFYANEKNWKDLVEEEGCFDCNMNKGVFDCIDYEDCEDELGGKRARKALEQIKERENEQ